MGFSSFITIEGRSIPNHHQDVRKTLTVYMHLPDGKVYKEEKYDGYCVFGGLDFFVAAAMINDYKGTPEALRIKGIDMYYGEEKEKYTWPQLSESIEYIGDFKTPPESCPHQGYFYSDEDENQKHWFFEAKLAWDHCIKNMNKEFVEIITDAEKYVAQCLEKAKGKDEEDSDRNLISIKSSLIINETPDGKFITNFNIKEAMMPLSWHKSQKEKVDKEEDEVNSEEVTPEENEKIEQILKLFSRLKPNGKKEVMNLLERSIRSDLAKIFDKSATHFPPSDIIAANIRGLDAPTEPEKGKFVYTNCLDREYDDEKKVVTEVIFNISRYGVHTKTLLFLIDGGARTEKEAILDAESYLSRPLTEDYYTRIQTDLFHDDIPWREAKNMRSCRGACLTDCKFLERVTIDKEGCMTLTCGS